MKKANNDIREKARAAGVMLWRVAAECGCNDGNFSRRLRFELPETEKAKITAIIERLQREGE